MNAAEITAGDVYSTLRQANVFRLTEVWAVVLETTGEIAVLHGDPEGPPLDSVLLSGVEGAEGVRTRREAASVTEH